jgi:signal transduction histidine kinase
LSTAYSDVDTAVKALRAGIYDYFIKPLDAEMFLATLNRCFEMIDLKAEAAQAERLRREAKRHEAVAQVVGGVAHHFNNLFAVILGNLELLAEQAADNGHQLDYMDNALEAIDEAASINQNLVAYVSQQTLTPEPLDIGVFLPDNREPLEHALAGGIRLELRIDRSLWAIAPTGRSSWRRWCV